MAFPTDAIAVRFRYALNPDLTAAPNTYTWVDFTTDVDFTFDVDSDTGQSDLATESNSRLSFFVKNPIGRYTIDNPESDLWPFWRAGTPIEYAWDLGDGTGWRVQQVAYLASVKLVWPSGTPYRCGTQVVAAGPFRRLGRDPVLASALRRTVPSSKRRKGFWPLEDAAGSLQAASYYPEVPPMVGTSPEFGTASLVPGAFSVATFKPGHNLFANFASPTSAQAVRLTALLHTPTIPGATVPLFELRAAGGTVARYVLQIGTGLLQMRAYNFAGTEVSGAGGVGFTAHQSDMIWLEWTITQTVPGTLEWHLRETTWRFDVNGLPVGSSGTSSGTFAGTIGGITGMGVAPTSALDDVQVGMLALAEAPLPLTGGFAAVLAWPGNAATGTVKGMCDEARVPVEVTLSTLGVIMGSQIPGSLLDNLRNVAETDHGVLTDHMGLVSYLALSELTNQPAVLTLSAAVRGELGRLDPVHDDQNKVNIASASRPNGSTATVRDDEDVLLSGAYAGEPITVNVALDRDLPGHAGWALAVGTKQGYDFRELTLKPHLVGQTKATQMIMAALGDRIAISTLPQQMAKGGVERILVGRKAKLRGNMSRHTALELTFNLVPTDVYEAFVLDQDRLETPGTEVIAAATSATTVLAVQTPDAPATVTGATSIDLWAAGERVTLTAVANETLEDQFGRVTAPGGWGSMPASVSVPAQPWTSVVSTAPGALTDFSTSGSVGTMSMQAASSALRTALNGLPMFNPWILVNGAISVTPTGDAIAISVQYRRGGGGGLDAYEAYVHIPPAGSPILRLYAPGAALIGETVLSAITHAPALQYYFRIMPIGSRHRVRVWTALIGEPAYWPIDVIDTTRLVPGPIGLRGIRSAGNTNVGAVTATWDGLSIGGVQRFTVTRGVGGFSKALPIGSQVKLWRGKGLGL